MDKKPQDSITYEKEKYQLTLESCFGTEKLVKVLKNLAVIEIHEQKWCNDHSKTAVVRREKEDR